VHVIGLTGGIGSGKSTVAQFLRELGATVIDADEGARAAVEPGTTGFERVVAEFGEEFVTDGKIDRARLAELVFEQDPDARRRLNSIVWPLVREWMAERQRDAQERGESVVVLEVPLLFEGGLHATMDAVIVVYIPSQLEVRRLMEKGYTEEQARARMSAQLSLEEKARQADYVIDNSGTREETKDRTAGVWREITARAAG
jgi:dephospho-CoA kinase